MGSIIVRVFIFLNITGNIFNFGGRFITAVYLLILKIYFLPLYQHSAPSAHVNKA
jgi:hypothetical protein